MMATPAPTPSLGGSPPPASKCRSLQQRKRKRLNAVLDKITNHIQTSSNGNNFNDNNDNIRLSSEPTLSKMFGRTEHHDNEATNESPAADTRLPRAAPTMMSSAGRKMSNAALRRELWRDNQQQSIVEADHKAAAASLAAVTTVTAATGEHVFKFDSFDKEKYLSSRHNDNVTNNVLTVEEDMFSPASGRSPHSSMSSPQVSMDSPRICFSPLRIKDSIDEAEEGPNLVIQHLPKLSVRGCESPLPRQATLASAAAASNHNWLMPGGLGSRPISPNPSLSPTTPISPSTTPLHTLRTLPAYLTEVYRRRCLSETDLTHNWEDLKGRQQQPQAAALPPSQLTQNLNLHNAAHQSYHKGHSKAGSLESETGSSTTQESPLDLSVRSSVSSTTGVQLKSCFAASMESIQTTAASGRRAPYLAGKGRSRSSTSRSTDRERYPDRLSLDRLDVVEAAASGGASSAGEVAYVCPICGQMFSLHDRLAKHMASRHKSRSTDSGSKAYNCDVCHRSFARSDMLTRHMRLHTGIKPYTCRVCGQVFSRSDHLSTHQRTHTGEKPYRCPSCPYAACRRDMITRHMRTHTRYELQESTSIEEAVGDEVADSPRPGSLGSAAGPSRSISSESADVPMPTHPPPPPPTRQQNKPDSPMDMEEEEHTFPRAMDRRPATAE